MQARARKDSNRRPPACATCTWETVYLGARLGLEIELDCDLHFAWAAPSRVGIDHSEVRGAICHVRRGERGSIGDVIRFEAQLEVAHFVQRNVFEYRHIGIADSAT